MKVTIEPSKKCPTCKQVTSRKIKVKIENIQKWREGMKPEEAFPTLTGADRALLTTGECNLCYAKRIESNTDS